MPPACFKCKPEQDHAARIDLSAQIRHRRRPAPFFKFLLLRRNLMPYVDGFVVPVPKSKIDAYREMANKAGAIWREHGALEFRECIADDVKVGEVTSFPRSVIMKDDETVVFSWIVYESRAARDAVNEKVMKD